MRNLKIEYFRLILITLIVYMHIEGYGLGDYEYLKNSDLATYFSLRCISVVSFWGVPGFILISGYYGVSFKWERIFSLWIQTFVYTLLSGFLLWLFYRQSMSFKLIFGATTILFNWHGYWFVADYVLLLFMSPLINKGIECVDKKSFTILVLFTSLSLYIFAWYHKVNSSMSMPLFFQLYILGRYLRKYPFNFLRRNCWSVFIVSMVILGGACFIEVNIDSYIHTFYNPFVILSLISLLYILTNKPIMGKGNFLTRNVLGVYLITESTFGRSFIIDYMVRPYELALIPLLIKLAIIVVLSLMIEEARKMLMKKIEFKMFNFFKYIKL